MSITITAEQAASLPTFVVDGCECRSCLYGATSQLHPAKWVDADQPCPKCAGRKIVHNTTQRWRETCPDCHGTGRTVIELRKPGMVTFGEPPNVHGAGYGTLSLGLFTIQVRPLVNQIPAIPITQHEVTATKVET